MEHLQAQCSIFGHPFTILSCLKSKLVSMDLQSCHFLLHNQEKCFNGSRAHLSFQSDTGLATQYWLYESFNRTDLRSVSFTFLLATLRWYSAFSCNSCLLTVSFSSSMPLSRSNWRNSKSSKRLVADSRASTFYTHTHMHRWTERRTGRGKDRGRRTDGWNKQADRQMFLNDMPKKITLSAKQCLL